MRVVMTLLCRNEADIIASMIRFHLCRGVDLILVTDNASDDGSTEILAELAQVYPLRVLHEPSHTHDQAVWVSRMAQMAIDDHSADWLIHADADEFWWATSGDLKRQLAAVPPSIEALAVPRTNFLPPPCSADAGAPFYQRQWIRERESLNSLAQPLPPKVCHRACPEPEIWDGNHGLTAAGQPVVAAPACGLEILHFPIRSYAQFERKIRQGTEALQCNTRINPEVGNTWRKLYQEKLLTGQLPAYYESLCPESAILQDSLDQSDLIVDRRLQHALTREG